MPNGSSTRGLPPEGVAETESALRHMIGLVSDPNTPPEAVTAIKSYTLTSAETAVSDLDEHRASRAQTTDARAN